MNTEKKTNTYDPNDNKRPQTPTNTGSFSGPEADKQPQQPVGSPQ